MVNQSIKADLVKMLATEVWSVDDISIAAHEQQPRMAVLYLPDEQRYQFIRYEPES